MSLGIHKALSCAGLAAATILSPSHALAAQLITNGDFSAGATGFTTTYTDATLGPNDFGGTYYILTNPATINCGSCFPPLGDHTTGTGNMLVLDGAVSGLPYYSTTVSVAPNTTYTFSYYSANLGTSGPQPLLATFVNGLQVGTSFTPTYNAWQQFTYTFNSGALSAVSLSLTDQTQTHSFNDFALDDVSLTSDFADAVPEPRTWAMMLVGFGFIGGAIRREKRLRLASSRQATSTPH